MANGFDPYHRWLGIPPEEQPPHHYRLLAIRAFEGDPDVIQNAVDQRMAHLRNYQSGQHAELCAKILNELAQAKVCLLNPERKATYDGQLRGVMAVPAAPRTATALVPRAAPAPPPLAPGVASAVSTPGDSDVGRGCDQVGPGPPRVVTHVAARRRSNPAALVVSLVAALLMVGAVIAVIQSSGGFGGAAVLVFDWPPELRSGIQITLDDVPLDVPAAGPWEHPCAPGTHRIVAMLPGYDPVDREVSVAAGDRCTIGVPARTESGTTAKTGPRVRPKERPAQASPQPGTSPLPLDVVGMKPVPFAVAGPSLPDYLKGATTFDFPSRPGAQVKNGVLQFDVRHPCSVLLLADWRRQGSPAGTWQSERLSRGQLAAQGWTDLGPAPWDKNSIVFHRACKAGESYRLRTNKYWPPKLVLLAAGAELPPAIKPGPGPVAVADPPDDEPQPPDEIAKPRERLPVPSEDEQKKVLAQLNDIYKLDAATTVETKRELAGELMELADESADRPAERFEILRAAARLAGEGGDAKTMLAAVKAMTDGFQVDALDITTEALERLGASSADAASLRAMIAAADEVIDAALDAGRYDLAARVADLACRACQKPHGRELRKQTLDRQQQVQAMLTSWKAWRGAAAALKANPDDPQANLAAAQWYCLSMNDWEKGLPHLAKAPDAKLKALAAADLAAASPDAAAQVKLGDDWYDAAQTAAESDKRLMLVRARHWYKQARSGEISSLVSLKVTKRLEEIAAAVENKAGATATPDERAGRFEPGKWVDLLPFVDAARDGVAGQWKPSGDDLLVSAADHARLALPVTLAGSYDLEVEFVRTDGESEVAMIFPVGVKQIALVFSADSGKCHGLEVLDGRTADSSGNPSRRQPGVLQNGRRYTALIGVRVKDDKAVIDVVFNGKAYMKTFGTLDGLSLSAAWDLNDASRPGLAANKSGAKFTRARIRLVDGKASFVGGG